MPHLAMSIAHLLRDSSSVSNIFCRRNSSINVAVISRSLSEDAATEIGGVTPRYLRGASTRTGHTTEKQTLCRWQPWDAGAPALTRQARWCEEKAVVMPRVDGVGPINQQGHP